MYVAAGRRRRRKVASSGEVKGCSSDARRAAADDLQVNGTCIIAGHECMRGTIEWRKNVF